MAESFEMSPQAYRWACNVVVAFRKARDKKGGYITKAWEEKKMVALKQWAGRKTEYKGIPFSWWMVGLAHNIIMFKEMNADGAATKTATQLAEFYRGKRAPKSSTSVQFRKAVNVAWFQLRYILLSDQYLSHIEYTIACQVVFDLMMKSLVAEELILPPKSHVPTCSMTFVAHVHAALERADQERDVVCIAVVSSPETKKVPSKAENPSVQLEFLW